MSEENLVKVVLEQGNDENDDVVVETPWALDLGNGNYQLKNFPFYFYGLSFDDIFEAANKYEDDSRPYFERVIKKSGNKTIRINLSESIKESQHSRQVLKQLESMECGHEGTNGEVYFVINIQPQCDFWAVCNFLTENKVDWEHADPTYKEIYAEDESPN